MNKQTVKVNQDETMFRSRSKYHVIQKVAAVRLHQGKILLSFINEHDNSAGILILTSKDLSKITKAALSTRKERTPKSAKTVYFKK